MPFLSDFNMLIHSNINNVPLTDKWNKTAITHNGKYKNSTGLTRKR